MTMITAVQFDVNNTKIRRHFLKHTLIDAIDSLTEQIQPLWGKMSAQHMVEHLMWAFELSTGKVKIHRDIPEDIIKRPKKFLYDNRPTPRNFKNPVLSENPSPLRFSSLADSQSALCRELNQFFEYIVDRPEAIHNHPLLGPLGTEEWERTHFKHCYHHLLQFELIKEG
jgi:hypothetical protein